MPPFQIVFIKPRKASNFTMSLLVKMWRLFMWKNVRRYAKVMVFAAHLLSGKQWYKNLWNQNKFYTLLLQIYRLIFFKLPTFEYCYKQSFKPRSTPRCIVGRLWTIGSMFSKWWFVYQLKWNVRNEIENMRSVILILRALATALRYPLSWTMGTNSLLF